MDAFIGAIKTMNPNYDAIYEQTDGVSLRGWRTRQLSLSGATGTLAAVPGLNLALMAIDVAVLVDRIGVASYGIGAILGREAGLGNILEDGDVDAVIVHWAGDEGVIDLLSPAGSGKFAAELGAKFGVKPGSKIFTKGFVKGMTKVLLKSSGSLVGGQLGTKVMAKVGSKLASKLAGKISATAVPLLGGAVNAGVNVWLVGSIMKASREFYEAKIDFIQNQ
ncbi:hypothetical protein ACR80R_00005 [Aquipuribacter sp. MA13-13]